MLIVVKNQITYFDKNVKSYANVDYFTKYFVVNAPFLADCGNIKYLNFEE